MRTLPLDSEAFKAQCLAAIEVVEDIDFRSKAQKVAATGEPVWKVRLLTRDGDDPTRRPEVTEVKVTSYDRPVIVPGVVPSFGGLVGIVWSGDPVVPCRCGPTPWPWVTPRRRSGPRPARTRAPPDPGGNWPARCPPDGGGGVRFPARLL